MTLETEISENSRFSPWIWSVSNIVLPGDALWNFDERRWQLPIFEDNYPRIVSKKSAQVGETTIFICKALWFMEHYKGRVIWTLPRQDDVTEFVQTRFVPLIRKSPSLARNIGRDSEDPRSVRITRYKDSYIYFQEASVEPRQTPADLLANDEIDRSNPDYLDAFVGRLSDSKFKIHYRFSTPTIPNAGIDQIFNNESDQRYWMIKCPHCGHRQSLKWDVNFMFDKAHEPYYGCEKCRGVLPPDAIIDGEFVAMAPSKTVHGYHITGMMLPLTKPPSFMYDLYQKMQKKNFYNLYLGETYEAGGLSFDSDVILRNVYDEDEEPYPHQKEASGATYMGVDQKGEIHVVIAQATNDAVNDRDVLRIIHAEVIPRKIGEDSWRRLAQLMRWYNVRFCVHDALPNKHNAEEFRNQFRDQVALKYDTTEHAALFKFDENTGKLILARTQNFDGLLDDIKSGVWRFWGTRDSIDPILKDMVIHAGNIKRDEEESRGKDGSVKISGVWRKTGPDDFVHAWAYCRVAYLVRPANRLQVTLIGRAGESDDKIEYVKSSVWEGLMVPKRKSAKQVRLG